MVEGEAKQLSVLSVSCQAYDIDAGNLARHVEAEQEAGRIAAREDYLHDVKRLFIDLPVSHNVGADRRCPGTD